MSVPRPDNEKMHGMMTRSASMRSPAFTASNFEYRPHTARTASSMMNDPSSMMMYPPRTAASLYAGPQTRSMTRSPSTRSQMSRGPIMTASQAPFARTRSHMPDHYNHPMMASTRSAFPPYDYDGHHDLRGIDHPAFTASDFNDPRSSFTPNTRSQFPAPVFSPRRY